MKDKGEQLIETIQASGFQACLVLTGGVVGVLHALLLHPGASRFLLEAQVPYSFEALSDYLGVAPESACSEETARLMAEEARIRAERFGAPNAVGIACTAALKTSRERRGADRVHICIRSAEKERMKQIDLDPGTRGEQEAFASRAMLALIAEFMRNES